VTKSPEGGPVVWDIMRPHVQICWINTDQKKGEETTGIHSASRCNDGNPARDFHRSRGIGPKHWEQEQWRDDCRETFRVDEMGNSNPNEGGSVNRRHNVS